MNLYWVSDVDDKDSEFPTFEYKVALGALICIIFQLGFGFRN